MRISDWSSDVCYSDLIGLVGALRPFPDVPDHLAGADHLRRTVAIVVSGDGMQPVGRQQVGLRLRRGFEPARRALRSEERRVGKEGVRQGRTRWSPSNSTTKTS